jgi:TonB family protein
MPWNDFPLPNTSRDETMRYFCSLCVAVCLLGVAGTLPSALGQDSQTNPSVAKPSQFVTPERLLKRVEPEYPMEARLRALQGTVVMTGTIAANGTVKDVKVVSGDPLLRAAAIAAVSQWKYEPYRVEGVATDISRTIPLNFTLGMGSDADQHKLPPGSDAEAKVVPPPLPPPPVGVIRVSGRVMAAQLDKRVEPVYPADSIAVDARGPVVLLVTIKKTGEVGDVQFVSGPVRFQSAALDAVKQWRYRPYEVDGAAVDVQITVTLNFAPPQTGAAH